MMTQERLNAFVVKMLSITAPTGSIFGAGMPGIGGTSAGVRGSVTGTSDMVRQMQQGVVDFAEAVQRGAAPAEVVRCAQELEGAILALCTFAVLTPSEAEELVEELHALGAINTDAQP